MAILLSHIFSQIRGSIAGITYYPNQWHQIIARGQGPAPGDPTPAQELLRDAFTWASALWTSTSEANRQGWLDYAGSINLNGPMNDVFTRGRLRFMANTTLARYAFLSGYGISVPNGTPPRTCSILKFHFKLAYAEDDYVKLKVYNPNPFYIGFMCNLSLIQSLTRYRFKGPWDPTRTLWRSCPPLSTLVIYWYVGEVTGNFFSRLRALTISNPYTISAPTFAMTTKL